MERGKKSPTNKMLRQVVPYIILIGIVLAIFAIGFLVGRLAVPSAAVDKPDTTTSTTSTTEQTDPTVETTIPETSVPEEKWIEFTATAYCPCEKCCGVWATKRPLDENGNPIVYVASPVLTMNWTVYAAYTHTLVIKEGNTTVLTITGLTCSTGTNNKTVTLTAAQRTTILKYMSSKQSFEATFYLTTYSGTTQIGSTVSKTATIQTTSGTSAPTFSGFTHKDSDKSGTLAITGNDQIYIKGYSSLQIVIGTKSAKNEASISSYKVTVGSDSKSFTTTTIEYGTISVSGNVTLKVEVIDSRGYSTAITKTLTVIDYEDISITDYTIRRKNEVEATVQLAFSGDIAPITIDGEAQNGVVSAKFRYAPNGGSWSGWSNLTVAETTRNFEYATLALSNSSGVLEFNPNSQYTIDIKITDRLSSDTMTIILNKGTPLVAFRAKKVGINTPDPQDALDVREGNIRMNGYVIQGFVADLGNTEDLHDLTHNGIWTQHLNANASTDRHYPVAKAGYLEVFENPQGYVLQRYTTFDCSGIYICYRYNDEWSAWRSVNIS